MYDLEMRPRRGKGPGDNEVFTGGESRAVATVTKTHPMDSPKMTSEHKRLLEWFYFEKDKQAANRLDMAMDHDFYDNIQWSPEDAAEVEERGQMPLVYNEVAPMIDWVIGTERRTRVDWKVFPRTEDDVQLADTKTDVLKYVSDVNRVPFLRSRAFADAVKGGVGWLDDGARDDPTKDILYSKTEDWRNILWDSSGYELDLSDARYLFRWRWVDEDIALMMFPDRADAIRKACEDAAFGVSDAFADEEGWQTPETRAQTAIGRIHSSGVGMMVDAKRRRVRIIECQYRKPATAKIVVDGPMRGAILNPMDRALADAVASSGSMIVDKVVMRMHIAVFTEGDMLGAGQSPYRHNNFSLTAIWCYRRGRDRLPYGMIRRVRDMQKDLNKRASKALFMLNTNQIIGDEGAVEDWNVARDEADRPDGVIVKRPNKEFIIRRDTDGATGQINMMTLAAQSIQKSAGVSQENMGRQTNAVSGEAIKARQLQGSVVTTEPFDNLRLAVQIQGEKHLSLVEQFYTQEKVVRLTGQKGALRWVKINVPEVQADGSIRFLNDITATAADFIVSEQDYAGTMRQVMFEALNNMATRLPPEVALRVLTIAMEYSDLPNKDEVADQIRKLTGERDPNKEMTPEEAAAAEQQMQQQMEALAMQRESAQVALAEQQAKVREINARAMKLEAEAQAAAMGGDGAADMQGQIQQAVAQVRAQADKEMDGLMEQLRKVQADLANRTLQINREADIKLESERIRTDGAIRVAEIQRASDDQIRMLEQRLDKITDAMTAAIEKATATATEAAKAAQKKPEAAPVAPAQPAPPPAEPAPPAQIHLAVHVDAKPAASKSVTIKTDQNGNITGADVTDAAQAPGKPQESPGKAPGKPQAKSKEPKGKKE